MTSSVYIIPGKCPERCIQDQFPFPSPLLNQCNAQGLLQRCSSWYVRRGRRGGHFLSRALQGSHMKSGSWVAGGTSVCRDNTYFRWQSSLAGVLPSDFCPHHTFCGSMLLCSFPGIPIHRNSLGVSKVLLCLRRGASYSTYSSQNLLHLHSYEQRNHQYKPESCYSSSAPGLPLCHHQAHAEPRRLQGLFRPSRTVSIKLRHQEGWSVLESRSTGSLTERIF